jgi:hypothetical protein
VTFFQGACKNLFCCLNPGVACATNVNTAAPQECIILVSYKFFSVKSAK